MALIVLFSLNEGGDKLDLNLGISLSSGNTTKQNGRLFHFPANTYETHQRGVGLTVTFLFFSNKTLMEVFFSGKKTKNVSYCLGNKLQIDNEFMGKPVNAVTPLPYGSADHRAYWSGACPSYNNPVEVRKRSNPKRKTNTKSKDCK